MEYLQPNAAHKTTPGPDFPEGFFINSVFHYGSAVYLSPLSQVRPWCRRLSPVPDYFPGHWSASSNLYPSESRVSSKNKNQ